MGWRGTVRSLNASMKRAAREAERREKIALKQEITEASAEAVSVWEDYLDDLVSVHLNRGSEINWHEVRDRPQPEFPNPITHRTKRAERALSDFRPGPLDFLKGGSERRLEELETRLSHARTEDSVDDISALKQYQTELDDWQEDHEMAQKVLAGDIEATKRVIAERQSLSGDSQLGINIGFEIRPACVHALPEVHGIDVVPNYRRKQLSSGKLSETAMPVSQRNELYQDYVASVSIRVASELFGILPLEEVHVSCKAQMLNSATGYQERMIILSVQFVRETLRSLNLEGIDPSASLSNFSHSMDFKKTRGFAPVEPLVKLADGPPPLPKF
ncbi:MAG: hypothetical protein ACFB01_05080 [Cohaesibacteraceae bacterium]